MKSKKVLVDSDGAGIGSALEEVESFSRLAGLDARSARRYRLLAEETMCMVKAIVNDFKAVFWIEQNKNGGCAMHLLGHAEVDRVKTQKLIDVSTSRRNEASVGVMGKIKDFIEDCLINIELDAALAVGGQSSVNGMSISGDMCIWTLEKYRRDVEQMQAGEEMEDLEEELGRSIVANLADDISVSVKGDRIEMIIRKDFPAGRI